MNYEQLTSLFRVEERVGRLRLASLANVADHVGATVCSSSCSTREPIGVVVGNFLGTLTVYLALLGYRREQLGLQLDRDLLREMNRFGMPLVPSALFLWVTNFADRFILVQAHRHAEVGLYSVGVRIASAMVLLLTAFRTAWPAFAYSIESDDEAKGDVRRSCSRTWSSMLELGRRPRSRCCRRGSCRWSPSRLLRARRASSGRSRSRPSPSPATS